jgi:HNH endonuclease.
MEFTELQIEKVWRKATVVEGWDSDTYRKDPCGAIIMRDKYGRRDNPFGWEIDHIYPRSMRNSDDRIENLRAMQYENNISKGDDFPSYVSAVTAEGVRNVACRRSLSINETTYNRLKEIYGFE